MKKYETPFISWGLLLLVVHDIPSLHDEALSSSNTDFISDVLPVPEGAEITNNLPIIKKSLL